MGIHTHVIYRVRENMDFIKVLPNQTDHYFGEININSTSFLLNFSGNNPII